MKLIWIFLLIIQMSLPAQAVGVTGTQEILPGTTATRNYIKNPSAFKQASFGTSTSSAAIARDTDSADKLDGIASFTCDASAQNGYCQWDTYTIEEGDKTGNCLASAQYKGDASLYKWQIYDGSNVVANSNVLSNVTDWTTVNLNYPCGSTRSARLTQTESGTGAAVNIGRINWSRAYNITDTNSLQDWVSFTPTGSWTANSPVYTGRWKRVGDDMLMQVKIVLGGAATATALTINVPTGYTIDTNKIFTGGLMPLGRGVYTDVGVNNYPAMVVYSSSSVVGVQSETSRTHTGTNPNDVGSAVTNTYPFTGGSTDYIELEAKFPITGWNSSTSALTPEQANWFIDANISGGNPDLGTSSQSAYIDVAHTSLTLTANAGSAPVGVSCTTTADNTVGNTTCSSGNEELGIVFDVPRAGPVRCVASFIHAMRTDATADALYATFQLINTDNGSQTVPTDAKRLGKVKIGSSMTGDTATTRDQYDPNTVNGFFYFDSAGKKTIRLMYEQVAAGTMNNNVLVADGGANNGQRDFHIHCEPVAQSQNQITLNANKISRTVTASTYTAVCSDEHIYADTTSNAITITLPSATTCGTGKQLAITKTNSGTSQVTVTRAGSDNIGSALTSTYIIGQDETIIIESDGTSKWRWVSDPYRDIGAYLNCDGASATTSEEADWISGAPGNISGGACTLTFVTNVFSAQPRCSLGGKNTDSDPPAIGINITSATAATLDCANATTDCTEYDVNILCRGAR